LHSQERQASVAITVSITIGKVDIRVPEWLLTNMTITSSSVITIAIVNSSGIVSNITVNRITNVTSNATKRRLPITSIVTHARISTAIHTTIVNALSNRFIALVIVRVFARAHLMHR
jgi:hypothetical protein